MRYLILIGLCIGLTACNSNVSSKVERTNAVEDIINAKIEEEDTKDAQKTVADTKAYEEETLSSDTSVLTYADQVASLDSAALQNGDIDFDLTEMNPDMVYAMIYQLMTAPDGYVGKKFRMTGNYYSSFYESTGKYYHYIIIEDALACCAQGMEFIWNDGNHSIEEYPVPGTKVEITGIFETYKEEGNELLYVRLNGADMRVVGE